MPPLFSSTKDNSKDSTEKTIKHQGSVLFASMGNYMKKWGSKSVPTEEGQSPEVMSDLEDVDLND